MADNIDITPGSGRTVATDDCGVAGHTQVVKLAISTNASATAIPADAANGLDVDVTRLPSGTVAGGSSLPAGTNNIGDVDVLTVPTDPFGANADAASASGSISAKLRQIATNGIPVSDGAGSLTVDNAGTFAAQDSQVIADNAGFTDGTSKVFMSGFAFDEVAGTALTENDAAAARIDSKRAQIHVIEDATTRGQRVAVDSSGRMSTATQGNVAHDGVAAGNPVVAAGVASAAAPSAVSADGDVVNAWRLRNGAAAVAVTAAGALIPGDATLGLAVEPRGGIAHDGADSGNPVKVGAKASATLSDDTMVSDGDRTNLTSDIDGAVLMRQGFPLGDLLSERVTDTGGTSTAFTNFGATASTRNYVQCIVVYNSSATAGTIDFRDGTAGAVLFTVPIPAGGGCVIANGGVPLFRTTANTALAYDVSGAISTVTISISGFKSKV